MKVNVNLFMPTGKWKYGGVVEVSEKHPLWSVEFRREVMANQKIIVYAESFQCFTVVITHRDDYYQDPSSYFCQGMWPVNTFVDDEEERKRLTKRPPANIEDDDGCPND